MCDDNHNDCKMLKVYHDHWKNLALYMLRKNTDMEIERDKYRDLAWLGYKVVHDNWEPTQFEQAYEELTDENHGHEVYNKNFGCVLWCQKCLDSEKESL